MCLKSKRELSGHKNKGDPLSVFKILDSFKKLPRLKKQIKKIEISHGLKTHTTDDKGQWKEVKLYEQSSIRKVKARINAYLP